MVGGRARAGPRVAALLAIGIASGLAAVSAHARQHHGCASPSVSAPRDSANPLALGIVYARLGMTAEAEQVVRAALKADPQNLTAERWLRQIREGRTAESLK